MHYLKIFFLIIGIFFSNMNLSYSQDKIVFIDLDVVLKKTNFGKSTLIKIDELNKKNIEELKSKESELKKIEEEIKKKQNIISQEQLDKEIQELKQMVKSYRNLKNDMVKKFEKQRNTSLNNFFSQINPIIQNYMNTNSISILLERKNVFIGKNNSDITDVIINEIDSNFK